MVHPRRPNLLSRFPVWGPGKQFNDLLRWVKALLSIFGKEALVEARSNFLSRCSRQGGEKDGKAGREKDRKRKKERKKASKQERKQERKD